MSAVIDHMRKVPLFRGMSTSALETVADRASETTFEDGETVTREGDPGDTFYIVTDGVLHVSKQGTSVAILGRATSSARSPGRWWATHGHRHRRRAGPGARHPSCGLPGDDRVGQRGEAWSANGADRTHPEDRPGGGRLARRALRRV